MNMIICTTCGVGQFCARPDQGFACDHCDSLIYPRDLNVDGGEVWTVDSTGTLGKVTDPAVSCEAMTEAWESWLAADSDPTARAAFQALLAAALNLRAALRAGLSFF
ncbi:hypothetical protein [Streptomyces sp. NPDC127108]|uniref:hypothetical protein n=1 Tax=Streptomyces sp. NPDC127108 TaxID=3345361 RepID=UPI003635C562